MLRGGQCQPVARERVQGATRHQFESDLFQALGSVLVLDAGGNPPSLDSNCRRVVEPGQGHEPVSSGLWHQGTQERVLLW